MGQVATIKGKLTAPATLTAINLALTTAGLATISAASGILNSSRLLLHYDSLPAMAVDVTGVEATDYHTSPAMGIAVALQVFIAVADDTTTDMMTTAEAYVDVVRAACETALSASYPLARWTRSDPQGEPFNTQAGLPALLLTLDFEVRHHADIAGTA